MMKGKNRNTVFFKLSNELYSPHNQQADIIKKKLSTHELKQFLDEKADQFNKPSFIERDPIIIPHAYSKKQDIEIAGLFAAVLAWGQRITIVKKCRELMNLMDNDPHVFVLNHRSSDLKAFENFRHRTFNATDTLYFIDFLKWYYTHHESLEDAFVVAADDITVERGLINFHDMFCSLPSFPGRTRKHIATPVRKSTCKRINMFLRWMVRKDSKGVDFGIWNRISSSQLVCPCDLHVDRVARKLKLVTRKQTDWITALELTSRLRELDPVDPVRYDFALFGLGIEEGWSAKKYGGENLDEKESGKLLMKRQSK